MEDSVILVSFCFEKNKQQNLYRFKEGFMCKA